MIDIWYAHMLVVSCQFCSKLVFVKKMPSLNHGSLAIILCTFTQVCWVSKSYVLFGL